MIMKVSTGTPLDKVLDGGVECDAVTNVYGPAGCGKTNIAISTMIRVLDSGKKVVYMDTESSFSLERYTQLGGKDGLLKDVIFVEPNDWKEQHREVLSMEKLLEKKDVGLVVVDSMVALYRLELDNENFQQTNKQLATQYSVLSRIARKKKIPVIVTNQVYGLRSNEGEGEKIELSSRTISKYWSKALVEIKKSSSSNRRFAIIRKHRSVAEGKSIEFEIKGDSLKEVGRLSFL
jgi:DNA repair protein RadB